MLRVLLHRLLGHLPKIIDCWLLFLHQVQLSQPHSQVAKGLQQMHWKARYSTACKDTEAPNRIGSICKLVKSDLDLAKGNMFLGHLLFHGIQLAAKRLQIFILQGLDVELLNSLQLIPNYCLVSPSKILELLG